MLCEQCFYRIVFSRKNYEKHNDIVGDEKGAIAY